MRLGKASRTPVYHVKRYVIGCEAWRQCWWTNWHCKIWVTTKLDNPWHKRVSEGIDSSLKSLDCGYVDLYLMHWPSSTDPEDLKKHYQVCAI